MPDGTVKVAPVWMAPVALVVIVVGVVVATAPLNLTVNVDESAKPDPDNVTVEPAEPDCEPKVMVAPPELPVPVLIDNPGTVY